MGIRVFIESKNNSFCEQIAYFKNESDYDVCFKAVEKKAKKDGYIITESLEQE